MTDDDGGGPPSSSELPTSPAPGDRGSPDGINNRGETSGSNGGSGDIKTDTGEGNIDGDSGVGLRRRNRKKPYNLYGSGVLGGKGGAVGAKSKKREGGKRKRRVSMAQIMMVGSGRRSRPCGSFRTPKEKRILFVVAFVCTLVALVFNVAVRIHRHNAKKKKNDGGETMKTLVAATGGGAGEIALGEVQGVSYYHCRSGGGESGGKGGDKAVMDIILLHGSAFTKENWKTSGILDMFCRGQNDGVDVSVTALDLSVRSDQTPLKKVLDDLSLRGVISSLPVAGLVTPSASGRTVTQWLLQQPPEGGGGGENDGEDVVDGIRREMRDYFRYWIPVASGSVMSVPEKRLSSVFLAPAAANHYPKVLAIYGDQDSAGKQSSYRLRNNAGAIVVELRGRHPCYLDSPAQFVETILRHIVV